MCLWCEVEERVYDSYRQQERKALETIREVTRENSGAVHEADENSDQLRCIWEKKLEYVTARMLRERLALEMADAELCSGEKGQPSGAPPRRFPSPTLPTHLLAAFERNIETLFDRLTRPERGAPAGRRRGRKLLPFPFQGDPAS